MNYVEVTQISYGKRIGGAIKGIFLGLLLIVGAVILLWRNEGRTINTTIALKEGEKITVNGSISPINTTLEGKLIYINGKADTQEVLRDTTFKIQENAIKLYRKVSMYQWKEKEDTKTQDNVGGSQTQTTTYSYDQVWDSSRIDSSQFKEAGHTNPSHRTFDAQDSVSSDVRMGDIKLSNVFIGKMDNEKIISLDSTRSTTFDAVKNISNAKIVNDVIYLGNGTLDNPQIGDIQISFYAVYPAEVSAIGQQQGDQLVGYVATNKNNVALLEYGAVSMPQMYIDAHNQNRIIAWLLRGLGLLLLFIGFNLLLGLISTLASVLPFLGKIMGFGVGLISFILALSIGSLVIMLAWLFVRPVLSISLLCALIVIITMVLTQNIPPTNT
ncbi:MAG: TMEM43 family protein [candidate division SR1 bacterium]|nr:TMEM43 family protein [candidate division SR1 bacterium]